MDTGKGNFAEISEDVYEEANKKGLGGVFKEGEVIEIKGSKFAIQKITHKTLKLLLLEHKQEPMEE